VEELIARWTSFGLGTIGLGLIAVYPIIRIIDTREQADIQRALAPLLSVSLWWALSIAWGRPETVD
jgi:hypothetical protein